MWRIQKFRDRERPLSGVDSRGMAGGQAQHKQGADRMTAGQSRGHGWRKGDFTLTEEKGRGDGQQGPHHPKQLTVL